MTVRPTFQVIPGSAVERLLASKRNEVFDVVEAAYRLYAAGDAINPDSCFLRYPDNPSARIIALPAHLGGAIQRSGLKWISSFPDNRASNLARASAVLILNDATTGYALACIEGSLISATRTAASAALAAEHLSPTPFEGSLSVIGAGIIARTTIEWLLFRNWVFPTVHLYDLDHTEAEHLCRWLRDRHDQRTEIHDSLDEAIGDASLVLFTTTAPAPYLADERLLAHCPTVLHLSLRDICTNVILASQNIVDDVDHCLTAQTSLHLTELATGHRQFVSGTLVDLLEKRVTPDPDRARIFSPFGLGVLDLAVGHLVFEATRSSNAAIGIPNFFSTATRW